MGSITLHPKLGVNPHMSFCPRCGKDAEELMLIGNRTYKRTCATCNTVNYGARASENCGRCGHDLGNAAVAEITEHEKLPATEPCNSCKTEMEEHKKLVAEGGVYWRCKDCHTEGIIKASAPFAAMVREKTGIAAPNPVGVEFSKDDCPVCGPKEEEEEGT